MVLIIFILTYIIFAEKIVLKTGTSVEGEIIGKSDVIIKIYIEEFHRPVAIEKENIEYIETSDGKHLSFDELQLKKKDFNPAFRVSPKIIRPIKANENKKLFESDIFEQSRRENADSSAMKKSRILNLFFNAPARWGGLGIGYSYMPGLRADVNRLKEFGFVYNGHEFDLRCLNAQIRRNLENGIGTIILDIGYGKKTFTGYDPGAIYEFASMRYVSIRYSLCKNHWLLSPGVSAGLMLQKAGVTHHPALDDTVNAVVDVSLDGHYIRPLLGFDFNFYDVITAQINLDLWDVRRGGYFVGLAFLMPFLQ